MKIELKGLKISRSLSEETTAYTATIYVDGVKAFAASNHGTGGPDSYHALPGYTGPSDQQISAWLAENEAPDGPFEEDPEKRQPYDVGSACDLEAYVNRIMRTGDIMAEIKRACRKVAGIEDGKFYTWKLDPTPANLAMMRAKAPRPGLEFINDRLDDPDVLNRAAMALTGIGMVDYHEALCSRLREHRLTLADMRFVLAENARAGRPCPDLHEEMTRLAAEAQAAYDAFKAERDAPRATAAA